MKGVWVKVCNFRLICGYAIVCHHNSCNCMPP